MTLCQMVDRWSYTYVVSNPAPTGQDWRYLGQLEMLCQLDVPVEFIDSSIVPARIVDFIQKYKDL